MLKVMMNLVVKVESSFVQGKALQGCCIANEGNQELTVSWEGKGQVGETRCRMKPRGLTHGIK